MTEETDDQELVDLAALTNDQRAGLACINCGSVVERPVPFIRAVWPVRSLWRTWTLRSACGTSPATSLDCTCV